MRLQLALNVRDMDAAVAFYSKMFGVAPHDFGLCRVRSAGSAETGDSVGFSRWPIPCRRCAGCGGVLALSTTIGGRSQWPQTHSLKKR